MFFSLKFKILFKNSFFVVFSETVEWYCIIYFFIFYFSQMQKKNLHIKILAQIMPVCTIAPPDKEMNDNALIKNVFFKIIAL